MIFIVSQSSAVPLVQPPLLQFYETTSFVNFVHGLPGEELVQDIVQDIPLANDAAGELNDAPPWGNGPSQPTTGNCREQNTHGSPSPNRTPGHPTQHTTSSCNEECIKTCTPAWWHGPSWSTVSTMVPVRGRQYCNEAPETKAHAHRQRGIPKHSTCAKEIRTVQPGGKQRMHNNNNNRPIMGSSN